jgi:hypothetical protein
VFVGLPCAVSFEADFFQTDNRTKPPFGNQMAVKLGDERVRLSLIHLINSQYFQIYGGRVLARFGRFRRTWGSAATEPPFWPPCAFVSVSVTGLSRERGDPMNLTTHWKYEDVSHRPVAVEGRSKRDAGHSETRSASSVQSPKGGWPCQRPLKQKEKRPHLGPLDGFCV